MRILIDARYLDGSYTGIATYSRMLIEHLARADQANEYQIVVRPGFREKLDVGPNFELLSYRPKPVSLNSYFRYHEQLDALGPDLVHFLSPTVPALYGGPVVVTVHDLQPFVDPDFSARRPRPVQSAYRLFYRWAYPATFAKSKWILCDSYATRDDVANLIPEVRSKLIVVNPGLDQQRLEPATPGQVEAIRAKFNLGGEYLLYYGSTRPNKNLPALVRAFSRLVWESDSEFEDLTLLLVLRRDRFFRDVERTVVAEKIQDRVRFLDPLQPNELRALLGGALVFCFPTKHEGFGFPPLEAMAAGVPVLAGRSGSLPEVLGENALFVDPDDLDEMSDGLRRLVTDGVLRQHLSSRGPERARRFNWMDTAEFVRDIYNLLF